MGMEREQQLIEIVRAILARDFGIAREDVVVDARLGDDLDFDSIDAVDLAFRLETETGMMIPEERFASIRTVGDLVAELCVEPRAPR